MFFIIAFIAFIIAFIAFIIAFIAFIITFMAEIYVGSFGRLKEKEYICRK